MHPTSRITAIVSALAVGLMACSSEPRSVPIAVVTGLETDTFSADPKVVRVDITVTSLDGTIDSKVSTEPGGTFNFGEIPEDQQINVEVVGVDEGGATVVEGRTLSGILLSAVEGTIPVFVQRSNQWARPPGGLLNAHTGAPAGVVGERYLMLTGGATASGIDPANGDSYDLLGLGGAAAGTFPRVASSIVTLSTGLFLIGADGATNIDYDADTAATIGVPEGMQTYAEIAGGTPIGASDGRTFVVGATRRGAPSDVVLEIAEDGTLTAHKLVFPRVGAAALWIEGVGLVVAGGSAEGAGVELLVEGASKFVVRDFPPDPTEGAGAVLDAPGGVALIGGAAAGVAAKTRRLDPTCSSMCVVSVADEASLPVALTDVRAFSLDGARVIAVGSEASGEGLMRAFLVSLSGTVTEVPLREPRRGATPIPAPNGTLALLGGEHPDGTPALSIETFFPR